MPCHIEFRRDTEKANIMIPFSVSASAAETFAAFLADYSTADIPYAWHTERRSVGVTGRSGTSQSLDLAALIFLRRAANDRLYALKIHAPDHAALFDDGQRITTTTGEVIAAAYSTLAGETFTFESGSLVG